MRQGDGVPDITTVLRLASQAGHKFWLEGTRIKVRPVPGEELTRWLRKHKREIFVLLRVSGWEA